MSDRGDAPAILDSTITCPECGTQRLETMPTDACQFYYECTGCGALLRPKPGHCCVFCSYGTVPCPPVQASRRSCGSAPGECTGTEKTRPGSADPIDG